MLGLCPVLAYCAPLCPPVKLIVKSTGFHNPLESLSGFLNAVSISSVLGNKFGFQLCFDFAYTKIWSWLSDNQVALACGEDFFCQITLLTKLFLPKTSSHSTFR